MKGIKNKRPMLPRGSGTVTNQGYRKMMVNGVRILEHRMVKEKILKRKLLITETVHHKNGNRLDNRKENLELWTSSHPYGQRVTDVLKWAKKIIKLYENTHIRTN